MTEEEYRMSTPDLRLVAEWCGNKDYLERIAKLQKLTEQAYPGYQSHILTTSGPMPEGETEYQRTFTYDGELKELPRENAQSFCRKKGIITP